MEREAVDRRGSWHLMCCMMIYPLTLRLFFVVFCFGATRCVP